jgi:AcrR family transcriptional regulator
VAVETIEETIESRRDQILYAASKLFASKGYQATSVGDIADALALTGPALYRHFPSKQAVLDAVCLAAMQSILEDARKIIRARRSPAEAFEELIRLRVSFAFGRHQAAFIIARNDRDHLSAGPRRELDRMSELYRAEWMRVLGNVRPDADTVELQAAFMSAHVLIGYAQVDETTNSEPHPENHLFRMARAVMMA